MKKIKKQVPSFKKSIPSLEPDLDNLKTKILKEEMEKVEKIIRADIEKAIISYIKSPAFVSEYKARITADLTSYFEDYSVGDFFDDGQLPKILGKAFTDILTKKEERC